MGFSRLFRSRWSALFWAGGILWTAYDVANAAPQHVAGDNVAVPASEDATGEAVTNADLAALAGAIGSGD